MFVFHRQLHVDRLLRSVTLRNTVTFRFLSSSTHFDDLGSLRGPSGASIQGTVTPNRGNRKQNESRHRFSGHKDEIPIMSKPSSSSFQAQSLPLGGRAFQKTLRSRLLNRNNRPLQQGEDLFYMDEIRSRIQGNIMTASSIVDTCGILSLFLHNYKHDMPAGFRDKHTFHALVKELIGNFIHLTMASSNDSTCSS